MLHSRWPRRTASLALLPLLVIGSMAAAPAARAENFVNFESGQVRPLAMSPDGTRLFAVNTPDNRLEVFAVGAGGLTHSGSVSVGLEPVAVAARSNSEVWVVNHLSDSVSIVDVSGATPRVTRTLLTCDEPRDIVFAGATGNRAFITTARRGQNCPVAMNATTQGIGRALVQVYDASNLGTTLAGTPIANLTLFGDTPRALARSADGNTVFAAVFHSGNRTTTLNETVVCDGGSTAPSCGTGRPGGLPAPNVNVENVVGPENGLIVKFNPTAGQWQDELGRNWTVPFSLPDQDVFAINASAATPAQTAVFAGVGTVLFNMVTNPVSGKVYVANTDARNEVRFEGPAAVFGNTTVQGHIHESRITVLDGASVLPRHLNKHIDYNVRPASPATAQNSLATPLGMAVTSDGATLYVAAFGSDKIGKFTTAQLEADTFTPSAANQISVSGGGPTGLVLDEPRGRLYAFTRFDNSISVIDTGTSTETAHVAVYNPEPPIVTDGRRFLYDAALTSSNGEASCSSCHIFGDFDSLAWDLGNPDDVVVTNPLPFRIPPLGGTFVDFHPLKGPMTTQSLRGMAGHGAMHWRGDRFGDTDVFDEDAGFKKFNGAFVGLIGRTSQLSATEMQEFTDFILSVVYPPNPVRALDQVLTTQQTNGRNLYNGRITDTLFNCNGCHTLNPAAGFFGGDGFATFEGETQMFKVPHLRNAYQKIGMFGSAGNQIRGFGFLHDGSVPTLFNFLSASLFTINNTEQRDLEAFILAYDSNLAPIVGQQTTLTSTNSATVGARISLMIQRDTVNGECDVVVKGNIGGIARGAVMTASGLFQFDRLSDALVDDTTMRSFAATAGQELTYTCVPPGSGQRIGIDRDADGFFDRDELDAGSDPANPSSIPSGATPIPTPTRTPTVTPTPIPTATRTATPTVTPTTTATPLPTVGIRSSSLRLRDDINPPINPDATRLSFRSGKHGGTESGVVVPAWGSSGDPTAAGSTGGGAVLQIYRSDGGTTLVTLPLPASGWRQTGSSTRQGYQYRDRTRANGPITSVTIRNGTMTIRGNGAAMYQLDGAPQNSMAIRLRLGSALEMCANAPARLSSPITNDTIDKFNGEPYSPAPLSCPAVPGSGSASRAFLHDSLELLGLLD